MPRHPHHIRRAGHRAAIALVIGALSLLASPAAAAEGSDGSDLDAARGHCTDSGGQVQVRTATWATNDDQANWVDLGRTIEVCRFQADDEAHSRIYVDLLTLWDEEPSLAAAAYLAVIPMASSGGGANPASLYCTDIYGTSQFGSGAAGGGWVNTDDPDDMIVSMCVFADGSMIDEWGLAYHSNGAVRGADLEPLLRSTSQPYPPIYASPPN